MDLDGFLCAHGWGDATRDALAGDASSRRYMRLCSGADRAILMIDPQDDTARFADLATHLGKVGLSAPDIYGRDPGLMLLEDFGDAQFAKVIAATPGMETPLYQAATDVLCAFERTPVPTGLNIASPDVLGQMIEPAFTHYLPLIGAAARPETEQITLRLTELLHRHLPKETVLVHRDYHAENLIWLPNRQGVKRVGLLDFQDALAGPPIYDLVSLLQDARRDVTDACREATLHHYVTASGRTHAEVMPLFHLLGIQRNLRILGVFARLAKDRRKPGYLSLIPRVWGHIRASLAHPVARDLGSLVTTVFPDPTPDRLTPVRVP